MKQHIWLVSGCRSGSHMVRRWSVQHLQWKYLLILIHCHTHINISCMLSQQAFATRTTSASCQSPSTTGRSASWSHITPVCEVIQAGCWGGGIMDITEHTWCDTEAVTLQVLSPTRPTMRAGTASELRPTSGCSTCRSSWRLSVLCFQKNSRKCESIDIRVEFSKTS